MIKFKIIHPISKRHIFGIVITEGNVKLLQESKPIHFNAEDLGLQYIKFEEMLVLYYKDNNEAIKDLKEKGYIDNNTVIEDIKITKQ